jgi:hypothetical protein
MKLATKAIRSVLWKTGIGKRVAEKYWVKKSSGTDMRYLIHEKKDVFATLPINFENEAYNIFLKEDIEKWRIQEEFILEMDDITVEPERCLGIKGRNELIVQTVVFTVDYQYPYILPHLLNRKKAKKLDKAVLYDGSASRNYFHHIVECVSSLYMFEKGYIPKDIPLIVNRYVYEQKFFQYLLKTSEKFRSLNWHIQEPGTWLNIQKLYRLRTYYFDKKTWEFNRSFYNIKDIQPTRKVFLNRDKKQFTRTLANEDIILKILEKYGFETVFAEHMTVEDQMRMFQETQYLVALTGMGLIQQFFMNYDEAHIIEIIPINRLMPEYYCQAYTLGIKYYDIVLGDDISPDKKDQNGNPVRYEGLKEYVLNPEVFEKAIIKMLNSPTNVKTYGNTQIPI